MKKIEIEIMRSLFNTVFFSAMQIRRFWDLKKIVLKVSRSRNEIVEPQILPKNE